VSTRTNFPLGTIRMLGRSALRPLESPFACFPTEGRKRPTGPGPEPEERSKVKGLGVKNIQATQPLGFEVKFTSMPTLARFPPKRAAMSWLTFDDVGEKNPYLRLA
jgi:hypothetical protein